MFEDKAAIAVLGPDHLDAGDTAGVVAEGLGRALSEAGYTLMVHGASGVAAAVVRGAAPAGGRVVTVVEEGAERLPGDPEGVRRVAQPTIFRSLETILGHADALLVLPGDLTALAALLQVWSYGTTRDGPYRPLILVGGEWPDIVKALAHAAHLDRRTRAMVTFAEASDEAVEALRYYVSPEGEPA
ncbi:MAG: hypothetical protein ACQEXJ_03615 [Myxococcota bacterium]